MPLLKQEVSRQSNYNTNKSFIEKAEQWKRQNDDLEISLKVEEELQKRRENDTAINKFNILLHRKRPQIIVASQTQIPQQVVSDEESESLEVTENTNWWVFETKGSWIDPYAAKRRKNARANARREFRRIQRLNKEVLSDDEDEQHMEIAEEPETMWKD